MQNVENIYIRVNTNSSGDVEYQLFNKIDCNGEIIEEGIMDYIFDNSHEKFIYFNNYLNEVINNNISIKVTDYNGCVSCMNKELPVITPMVVTVTPTITITTTITGITVTPTPTPIPVYGYCFEIIILKEALNYNYEFLYIEKTDPITSNIIKQPYYSYPALEEESQIRIVLCSTLFPLFSYGELGEKFAPLNEISIIIGDICRLDNECTILI